MSRYGRFSSNSRNYRDDSTSSWFNNSPAPAAAEPATPVPSLQEAVQRTFGENVKLREVQAPQRHTRSAAADEPEFCDEDECLEAISAPSI